MAHKAYTSLDIWMSENKEASRKTKENKEAQLAYERGKVFAQGVSDGKKGK